ncbi:MAG TPA: DUF4436 family protein [Xanthobacteraceae bacterium]
MPNASSEPVATGEAGRGEGAPSPERLDPTPHRQRIWALLTLAILGVGVYIMVLLTVDLSGLPSERSFEAGPDTPQRLKIYLEPLSVDPVNAAIQVRVEIAPDRALLGSQPNAPDRDLTVVLTTDDLVEQRVYRANQPIAAETIRLNFAGGSVVRYPFDRYHISLRVQAIEGTGATSEIGHPIAHQVTVWEGTLGYRIRATQASESAVGDMRLRLDIRRVAAQMFFALAAYVAMVVLACGSLTISSLVFLGHRKPEAALVGALAALVFTLPALRNAMPGGPPLGVWADLAVFLWAELAAVTGIGLLVLSWARQGVSR